MKGGTFTPGQEKVRPGIYFNFTERANDRVTVGERGRAAIPLILSWGEPKKIIEIKRESDASDKLGLDLAEPSLLLLREVRKRANEVLVYRVNEGEKAKADLTEGVKVEAKYGGSKGNDIKIRVANNVIDDEAMDVTTFFGAREIETQTVKNADELKGNECVAFSGSGVLEEKASVSLSGGSDKEPITGAYTDFLSALETESFDVVALPVDEEELKVTFTSFIKRLREDQGIKVQGVVADYDANYEGVVNVTNGVVLENDKTLSPAETTAWVAGAIAGASLKQSLTFMEYEGAVDVEPRYDHDETVKRLKKGEFLFTFDGRDKTVTVEKDQNSLESDAKFSLNKVIRIIDAFHNDVFRSFKDIIKNRKRTGEDIPVSPDGVSIVQTAVALYLNLLQDDGVVMDFDPKEDIEIEITAAGDGFIVNVGIQPVGSAEKFYFAVEVR
ncbi:phage tail sheath family protein [Lentibacillus sp. N15]|uniref:phage tail sheath family protein n=1 Tax=Lentibacillus songyuanensis TaxID=3136161 RepID=UPI0031BAF8DE